MGRFRFFATLSTVIGELAVAATPSRISPSRASPAGISERSLSSAPKYRAACQRSPRGGHCARQGPGGSAHRNERLRPATSTVPFSGAPRATLPTALATSSAAMG